MLKKLVNGQLVDMTSEEISERESQEAAYAEKEAATGYITRRVEAYPPIGDQLDAVLKLFLKMKEDGNNLPPELDEIICKWQDVKAEFPKPSEKQNFLNHPNRGSRWTLKL